MTKEYRTRDPAPYIAKLFKNINFKYALWAMVLDEMGTVSSFRKPQETLGQRTLSTRLIYGINSLACQKYYLFASGNGCDILKCS